MDIPPILTLPDVRLRQVAASVEVFDSAFQDVFQMLDRAMRSGPGGVGIAAPQLAIARRMLVVDCTLARHACRNHGLLYMANPEIIESSQEKKLGREGCLSVPEWVGTVSRARSIRVRYQDALGTWQELTSSGFEARVIQHEIDHLDGVLFIDQVVSTADLLRRLAKP
ncbi:MAG: peptide deformylase [Mariprofundaceae bacterium]|nr:peptide deformylase [Mariprofundaceae bacterium]